MSQTIKQLAITFTEPAQVVNAYMPFLKEGGFFIPTTQAFSLGDELFIALTLPDKPNEKSPVPARVAWINPPHAFGGRKQGIGVMFTGIQADSINRRFKQIVSASDSRSVYTNTM